MSSTNNSRASSPEFVFNEADIPPSSPMQRAVHCAVEHTVMIVEASRLFNIPVSQTIQAFRQQSPLQGMFTLQTDPLPIPPCTDTLIPVWSYTRDTVHTYPFNPVIQMDASLLRNSPLPSPIYAPQTPAKSPLPPYEPLSSPESEIRLTSPQTEGPQVGQHPGEGWVPNEGVHTYPGVCISDNQGGPEILEFLFYEQDKDEPRLLATRGHGCHIYLFPLYACPDKFPRRVLTEKEEFGFQDGKLFSPLVDLALVKEGDPSLAAEVWVYRGAHHSCKRLAKHMAQLKEQYTEARWERRASVCRLACANAIACIEPRVLSGLNQDDHFSPSLHDKAILTYTDLWLECSRPEGDECTWCRKAGHDTHRCPAINKCLYCGRWGHLEHSCYHTHINCKKGKICHMPRDHQKHDTMCRADVCTFSA
ncbi:hypothetical protein DFH94DRAFT_686976 [Russula ochroleuca]|uniref:CCHC-type domain-containing protein n=1 Tax=Russula ochroleuca TaxID=152965 RepID=A0A9P5JUM0_9AGAM|nr:hypothetical protein DFH94DRAFT_686976 [Russula ochroleuca]